MSVPDARHIPRQQGLSKLILFLADYEAYGFHEISSPFVEKTEPVTALLPSI
jgi:hypothetical protein